MPKRKDHKREGASLLDIEQIELRGFARSITEIEWLLLLLVTLYYVAPGTLVEDPFGLHMSLIAFGIFAMSFNYINADARYTRFKLLIETLVMFVFITWAVLNTGAIESPLVNLYILVIIASAVTLGKIMTFIQISLIAVVYLIFFLHSNMEYSLAGFSELLLFFSPFLVIAYITTMLVADMHYGRRMFKALSEVDELTSLLNKRSFNPLFSKTADVAARYSQSLSMMLIDIDHLRDLNDRLGQEAGDALIRNVAFAIEECLRSSDLVCRYGGDEFAVLLPRVSVDKAYETAERIRHAIHNFTFDYEGQPVNATVSIGVATFPSEVMDVNALMEKADAALSESKALGRNRVVNFSAVANQSSADYPETDPLEEYLQE